MRHALILIAFALPGCPSPQQSAHAEEPETSSCPNPPTQIEDLEQTLAILEQTYPEIAAKVETEERTAEENRVKSEPIREADSGSRPSLTGFPPSDTGKVPLYPFSLPYGG